MASVSYQPRSLPAGISSAELDTAVVPAAGGGSLLRADATVTWYPARSAAERIDPARYREAVVSITMFNPGRHTVTRAITSRGTIARLAGQANGLHAAPYQPPSCPAILASYRITFVPAARPAPRVVVTPSGCLTVGVTVAGAAQPQLWGDTGLIAAAKRLLHVKSLLAWGATPLEPPAGSRPRSFVTGPRPCRHGCGPGAAAQAAAPGPRLSCQPVAGSAGHGTVGSAFCTSIWNSAGNHCPAGMSYPGMEFVG